MCYGLPGVVIGVGERSPAALRGARITCELWA
jgi:hypothetical protein